MKGRVGHSVAVGLPLAAAVLTLSIAGCQRAKPARVVTPPPTTPRVETPVIAQVAQEVVAGYPAPVNVPVTPAVAGISAPYPFTAAPPASPTPQPTDSPTTTPPTVPTERPTATPTTGTTPAEALPTPVPEVIYRVKAGDSLGSIAVLYNTTTAAIRERNGLSGSGLIHVGQELIIPAASPDTIPAGSTVRHTVRAGESLADIARYYRTTSEAILARNPTAGDPNALTEGTVLTVIVGSESAARTHVVRAGETLGLMTTQALARANGLTDPSRIRVGQTLIVP